MNPLENAVVELQSEHALKHKIEHHASLLTNLVPIKDGMHFFKPDFDRVVFNPIEKKIKEDQRFEFLLRMNNSLNDAFDNKGYVHPHGMTEYDYRSIPEHRRPGLEHFKMRTRRENYSFLNLHSEIDALMSLFIQRVLKAQPADPIKFAVEFFTLKGTSFDEFSKLLEEEKIKLRTHRTGNLSTGKVGKFSGWSTIGMKEVNEVKSLNLGPVAERFCVTPPPTFEEIIEVIKAPGQIPPTPEKPKKKYYCGCKDKGRREFAHPKKPPPSCFEIQKCDLPLEWEGEEEEEIGEYEEMPYYGSQAYQEEEEDLHEDNRRVTNPTIVSQAKTDSKSKIIEEERRRATMLSEVAELRAQDEQRRATKIAEAESHAAGPRRGSERKRSSPK